MNRFTRTALWLLAAAILLLPGCVILCGQRISWFYDQAADELKIQIYYDGIHESGDNGEGDGAKDIPEFVKNGDVMAVDWPFHLKLGEAREKLNDPQATVQEKTLAEALQSVKVSPLGYYREQDGRIGAAQLITISHARDFLRQVNRLINRAVLDNAGENDYIPRSWAAMKAAAGNDHPWILLDGHSLRVVVPMDAVELSRVKGEAITGLAGQIVKEVAPDAGDDDRTARRLSQALASIPIGYTEAGNRVTFVLGRPDAPSTLRLTIREKYQPNLEPLVIQTLLTGWDAVVAGTLLNPEKQPESKDVSALLAWGPPEQRVNALLRAAGGDDASQRPPALAHLKSFASDWNQKQLFPSAPSPGDDEKAYLEAWRVWYGKMKRYPFEP